MNRIIICTDSDELDVIKRLNLFISNLKVFEIKRVVPSEKSLELFIDSSLNSDIFNSITYSISRLSRIALKVLNLIENSCNLKIKFEIEYDLLSTTIPIQYRLPINIKNLQISDLEKIELLKINPIIVFNIKNKLNKSPEIQRFPITQLKIASETNSNTVKIDKLDFSSHDIKVYYKSDFSTKNLEHVMSFPMLKALLDIAMQLKMKTSDIDLQFIWGSNKNETFSLSFKDLDYISNLEYSLTLTIYV